MKEKQREEKMRRDIETNFRGESGLTKNSLLRMSNLRNNPFEDSKGRNSRQKPFFGKQLSGSIQKKLGIATLNSSTD